MRALSTTVRPSSTPPPRRNAAASTRPPCALTGVARGCLPFVFPSVCLAVVLGRVCGAPDASGVVLVEPGGGLLQLLGTRRPGQSESGMSRWGPWRDVSGGPLTPSVVDREFRSQEPLPALNNARRWPRTFDQSEVDRQRMTNADTNAGYSLRFLSLLFFRMIKWVMLCWCVVALKESLRVCSVMEAVYLFCPFVALLLLAPSWPVEQRTRNKQGCVRSEMGPFIKTWPTTNRLTQDETKRGSEDILVGSTRKVLHQQEEEGGHTGSTPPSLRRKRGCMLNLRHFGDSIT